MARAQAFGVCLVMALAASAGLLISSVGFTVPRSRAPSGSQALRLAGRPRPPPRGAGARARALPVELGAVLDGAFFDAIRAAPALQEGLATIQAGMQPGALDHSIAEVVGIYRAVGHELVAERTLEDVAFVGNRVLEVAEPALATAQARATEALGPASADAQALASELLAPAAAAAQGTAATLMTEASALVDARPSVLEVVSAVVVSMMPAFVLDLVLSRSGREVLGAFGVDLHPNQVHSAANIERLQIPLLALNILSAAAFLYSTFATPIASLLPTSVTLPFSIGSLVFVLVLIFRATTANQRYMTAQRTWKSIADISRDLLQQSAAWATERGASDSFAQRVPAFAVTAMCHCREASRHDLGEELARTVGRNGSRLEGLSDGQINELVHPPADTSAPRLMLQSLRAEIPKLGLTEEHQLAMEENITRLDKAVNTSESIREKKVYVTPVGFTEGSARFLFLWLAAAALVMPASLGGASVLLHQMLALAVLGTEDMCRQVAEPFERLSLENFVGDVVRASKAVRSGRETFPSELQQQKEQAAASTWRPQAGEDAEVAVASAAPPAPDAAVEMSPQFAVAGMVPQGASVAQAAHGAAARMRGRTAPRQTWGMRTRLGATVKQACGSWWAGL